jgi:hypothetical protein
MKAALVRCLVYHFRKGERVDSRSVLEVLV